MFQFAGLPLPTLCVQVGVAGNGPRRVAPFGDPRVVGHVPLTAAYRSLSRPSSASSAKASTVCPYHLLSNSMVRYIHTLAGRVRPRPARSDAIFLKKKISSLSRYAALKVREGETLRTGYRALPGVESSASNSMYLRVPDGTAALVKKSSVSPKR